MCGLFQMVISMIDDPGFLLYISLTADCSFLLESRKEVTLPFRLKNGRVKAVWVASLEELHFAGTFTLGFLCGGE